MAGDLFGAEAGLLCAEDLLRIHSAEVFIGAVTIRFDRALPQALRPDQLPAPDAENLLNRGALLAFAVLTTWFVIDPQLWQLALVTPIALILGRHLAASNGGGEMPVVVSMLNSYSGGGAATSSFLLEIDLLIITGTSVGSSGKSP